MFNSSLTFRGQIVSALGLSSFVEGIESGIDSRATQVLVVVTIKHIDPIVCKINSNFVQRAFDNHDFLWGFSLLK